jgi:deoxyribose-phosphate aldolase
MPGLALDSGALLSGRYATLVEQVATAKDAADPAPLTVVVGTDELGCYEDVRRATLLAIAAGANFVEVSPASLPDALCVLEAIRDAGEETGHPVGFKASGCAGVEDAIHLLVLVHETLGPGGLTPERCRLAGTRLLEDLCSARERERRDSNPRPPA